MLVLSQADRRIGVGSAGGIFVLGLAYALTLALGFGSAGTFTAPIIDPYLAAMQVEIVLMAPLLVLLFATIHASAQEHKAATLAALGFVLLAAGTTSLVHFVLLTVGRQPDAAAGLSPSTAWMWPSVVYAADIVAWDLFLGLALVLVAPALQGEGLDRTIRVGLRFAGTLCLAGLVGPLMNDLRIRWVGIAGYTLVLPLVCLLLARRLARP